MQPPDEINDFAGLPLGGLERTNIITKPKSSSYTRFDRDFGNVVLRPLSIVNK
jgi:hypothetical protein